MSKKINPVTNNHPYEELFECLTKEGKKLEKKISTIKDRKQLTDKEWMFHSKLYSLMELVRGEIVNEWLSNQPKRKMDGGMNSPTEINNPSNGEVKCQ